MLLLAIIVMKMVEKTNERIFLEFVEDIASRPKTSIMTKEKHMQVKGYLQDAKSIESELQNQKLWDFQTWVKRKKFELVSGDPHDVTKRDVLAVPMSEKVSQTFVPCQIPFCVCVCVCVCFT